MKIKDFSFEIYVMAMILILAFAEFAPVEDKFALAGYFIAFGIGVINTLIIIVSEIKKKRIVTGTVMTLIVSAILMFEGYYSKGIIVLAAIIVVKSQFKVLKNKCKQSIDRLKEILPDSALVFIKGIEGEISAGDIKKGNVVIVKKGEKIPVDGIVFSGKSVIDENGLIGIFDNRQERSVKNGDLVFAGSLNRENEIQVEAVKTQENSLMGEVLKEIRQDEILNSNTYLNWKRVVSICKYLTIGLGVSLILIWIFLIGYEYKSSLYWGGFILLLSNIDLTIDVIEISLKNFMLKNVKKGVLARNVDKAKLSGDIDRLLVEKNSKYFGGSYKLVKIYSEGIATKEEMLVYAAHLENDIKHPISKAVLKAFLQLAKYEKISPQEAIRKELVNKVEYIKESGVTGSFRSRFICFGNENLMSLINIKKLPKGNNVELVHMAIDGQYAGYMAFRYIEKEGIKDVYENWKIAGIRKYANMNMKYKETIKELNQDKKKNDSTGVVSFKEYTMAKEIAMDFGIDVWLDMGGFEKRNIVMDADVMFLDNNLNSVGSFISRSKKYFKNMKKGILCFMGFKVALYAIGYLFIPSISTTFMIDNAISMIAIYKIA